MFASFRKANLTISSQLWHFFLFSQFSSEIEIQEKVIDKNCMENTHKTSLSVAKKTTFLSLVSFEGISALLHGQELPPSSSSPWITDLEVYDIITYAMLVRTGEVKWEKKGFRYRKGAGRGLLIGRWLKISNPLWHARVSSFVFCFSSVASLFYYIPMLVLFRGNTFLRFLRHTIE